jgi:hypothetical protein
MPRGILDADGYYSLGWFPDNLKELPVGSIPGYIGEDLKACKKTPHSHPYSYDSFVIWNSGEQATSSIYSDRLFTWDHDKHDELCIKHFDNVSQQWGNRNPNSITLFLRDWTGSEELMLTRIVEYCNVSSGYPCWRLDYALSIKEQAEVLEKTKTIAAEHNAKAIASAILGDIDDE